MQTPSNWQKLLENVNGKNFCLGVDPHREILERVWNLENTAKDLHKFCKKVLKVAVVCKNNPYTKIAAIKPQSAFFERFGYKGVKEFGALLSSANLMGIPTIADVKRGDIGSTMSAYCDAYLNPDSPLCADSITVSPFLGTEELRFAAEYAKKFQRGIFVLCRTSNSGADEVQNAQISGAELTVARRIFDFARNFNLEGASPTIGLVVGATIGENDFDFANFNGPILSPGIGAQGATVSALPAVFGAGLKNALPSVSRAVLNAGPKVKNMVNAVERVANG
jgi:orotidine-5'-phosphate decarboxylase